MASNREMQNRIRTVESIGQLTRALQAVSASQVRVVRVLSENTLPYTTLSWQVLTDLYHEQEFYNQIRAFQLPDVSKDVLIVFISADRGLAGSYPVNIFREVNHLERKIQTKTKYITIGKKGRDMLQRRRKNIIADFSELSTATSFHDLKTVSEIVIDEFNQERVGQVYLVYTEYESISRFTPTTKRLLPFVDPFLGQLDEKEEKHIRKGGCIFEGDPQVILKSLITRFIRMELFHAVTSSKASEHTMRMLAMNQATENSEELLQSLQLKYNKIRQENITKDILDIMGGSEVHSDE
ncbi:MAG TPA: ATP synthase F1 subunit gamma [Flexilinea sp.]|jgi:F-type H+-transporting ATPase subunit gamma|nr:ATP synthase F1 subunit gamma [Flexilinea sp.]HOG21942.1 ATP synthase F1 subunit gamma [Flexilinea sp.]HOG61497.1 ATP synthase F1 subunit gamma [Flexilinea sp.]HOP02137.1 ATP synthase F1 subunit gamma [Flexilinea sp.]HOU20121.1 ATP synthase F1 subunit gamma [Flexilinea sp.]